MTTDDAASDLPRPRKRRGRPIPRQGEGGITPPRENNYLAQSLKNPVGARPGNRNAVTHGRFTARGRALRRRLRDLKARLAALLETLP